MAVSSKQRNPAMDIIRLFALFTVISVHFFMKVDFYNAHVVGVRMFGMVCMRDFFMICVPLFLLLSGYLMKNKTLSKSYYKGLVKTLVIYALVSLACGVYRIMVLSEPLTFFAHIMGIFDYTTAPYAWYVEMYIGLFLMIPFLNLAYNNLQNKKQKVILVGTMIFLTSIPSVINEISSGFLTNILPDWWSILYPITYYFIGCYLREHPVKINTLINLLLIIVFIGIFGLINYVKEYGKEFPWSEFSDHKSIFVLVLTVLVFSFFANLKYKRIGEKGRKVLGYLSNLVFGAYLCSWIFDDWFYGILNANVSDIHIRFNYFILMVAAVFVCSLALSAVLNLIYKGIAKLCSKLYSKHKNLKSTH